MSLRDSHSARGRTFVTCYPEGIPAVWDAVKSKGCNPFGIGCSIGAIVWWCRCARPPAMGYDPVRQRREGFLRDHVYKVANTFPAPSPPRSMWLSEGAFCGGEGWGEGARSLALAPSPRPSPPQWSLLRKPCRLWGRGGRTLENASRISFTALPEGLHIIAPGRAQRRQLRSAALGWMCL